MNDLITKEQASESDMRAISQMFARAANAVVDASELGKTVKTLQGEVEKLVGDTQRLREHISWLEQENVTLRGQRDEAQNALSDAQRNTDILVTDKRVLEGRLHTTEGERDNARGEAKLWQDEAGALEKDRNDLKAKVLHLTNMLDKVWISVKDNFTEPQAPKPEPAPITQSTDPLAPHYVHQPRDEYGRWVDPKQDGHVDQNIGNSEPMPRF